MYAIDLLQKLSKQHGCRHTRSQTSAHVQGGTTASLSQSTFTFVTKHQRMTWYGEHGTISQNQLNTKMLDSET